MWSFPSLPPIWTWSSSPALTTIKSIASASNVPRIRFLAVVADIQLEIGRDRLLLRMLSDADVVLAVRPR